MLRSFEAKTMLTEPEYKALKAVAAARDRSVSWLVRRALLDTYLAKTAKGPMKSPPRPTVACLNTEAG